MQRLMRFDIDFLRTNSRPLRIDQSSAGHGKTKQKLSLLPALWADEAGFILSAELVIIATVLVLGLTTMMVAVRDSVGGEMTDLANSFSQVDQSYAYSGMRGVKTNNGWTSWTAGSSFLDSRLHEEDEQGIIVGDHVVGTVNGVKQPCNTPPCTTPPCTEPPCMPPPCTEPGCVDSQVPSPQAPVQTQPRLEAPRLNDSEAQQSFERLPTPSSDIPPSSMRNSEYQYYPSFSSPRIYGPLQVW